MRPMALLLLLSCATLFVAGQETPSTPQAVAPLPQEEAQPPKGALGELLPLTLESEPEGGTYVIGSVDSTVSFDDNANSNNAKKQGGVTYELLPSIGLRVERPSLSFEAQYGPGWSWDQRLQSRNVFSQRVPFHLNYRMTRHWTLGMNNEFKVTSNPIDRFTQPNAGNLFDQPNGHYLLPHLRELTDVAGVEVNGQLSRRATVNFSSGYNMLQFDNVASNPSAQLVDSEMVNARGSYSYQIREHQSLGGLYNFQRVWSGKDNIAQTDSHSFFATYRIDLTQHSNLQLYGGPEYSHVQDQLIIDFFFFQVLANIDTAQWSGAGGALYTWQGRNTGFRADFRRTISNGGGYFGASRLHEAHADWSRSFDRIWRVDISSGYGDTQPLNLDPSKSTGLKTFDIGGSVLRQLRDDLDISLRYGYFHQSQSAFTNQRESDHNRVALTLQYRFKNKVRR